MNQQQLSEQIRNTHQRSLEHFKFEEFSHSKPRLRVKDANDRRQSFVQGKKKNRQRKDGFARWSDYITYDSDEIENFDTDEESSYLKLDPDDSSEIIQAEKGQKSLQIGTAVPQKKQRLAQNISKQNKDRRSELTKRFQQPISSYSKTGNFNKQTANLLNSPFSVPNISQIKKKELSSKRNSQQFLLNLLEQEIEEDPEELAEKKKLIQKQQIEERQKRKKEDELKLARKKQAEQRERLAMQQEKENYKRAQKLKMLQKQKKIKQAQQRQKKKNKQQKQRKQRKQKQKQIEKIKKEEKKAKANQQKSKDKKDQKSVRSSKDLKDQKQKQEVNNKNSSKRQQKGRLQQSQANKSKRVTINDRGKIKYPNDSISGQFQYILPEQLRRVESSIKKPVIIQESDDEDLFKQQQVPMDIIDFEIQRKLIQQAAQNEQKRQLQKAQERLQQISKKQTKKMAKTRQNNKKTIRINNTKLQKNQSFQANRLQSNQKKSKQKQVQKSTNKISQPRKRVKRSQEISIEETLHSQENVVDRPKRIRTNALKYWKNERPVYHAGKFLGCTNISSSKFLEILEVQEHLKIMTGIVTFRSKQIKLKISLGPSQRFISRGIDQEIMKQYIHLPSLFDAVEILSINKLDDDQQKLLRVKVKNQTKKLTNEPFRFQAGQNFSIENLSSRTNYRFTIALVNSKNSGFTNN